MKTLYLFLFAMMATSAMADDVTKKLSDGTTVVNTTTLCNARGYRSTTPLEVYIKGGKVVKVVALKNEETKTYFAKVQKALLPQYSGLKLAKAKKLSQQQHVDGCTGATFSTKAVQKNVLAAIEHVK